MMIIVCCRVVQSVLNSVEFVYIGRDKLYKLQLGLLVEFMGLHPRHAGRLGLEFGPLTLGEPYVSPQLRLLT